MKNLLVFLLSICLISNNLTLVKAEDQGESAGEGTIAEVQESSAPEITPDSNDLNPTLVPTLEPEPNQKPEIPVDKPTKSPEIVVTPPNTDEPLNTSKPELSSELESLSSIDFTNPEYPDLEVDFNTLHQRSEIALFSSENNASDFKSAADAVKEALISREATITVTFPVSAYPDRDNVIMD